MATTEKELTATGAKVTTVVTAHEATAAPPHEPGECLLTQAVAEHDGRARASLPRLQSPKPPPDDLLGFGWYVEEALVGAAFVGHLQTDLDSIASAIGGALLYGGSAARASEVNSETFFALDYWQCAKPPPIDELLAAEPARAVCLVDHHQPSQVHPAVLKANARHACIVGVIDHHAIDDRFVTASAAFVDIRPWGSASTIVAHSFLVMHRALPRPVAGLLLSAILSDTLNLMSPTTTEWDRRIVTVLAMYTETQRIDELASMQFAAKSASLSALSAHDLISGDRKAFRFAAAGFTGQLAFAVVETTAPDAITSRERELVDELRAIKALDKDLHVVFLAVVDIVKLRSTLYAAGPRERSLARVAFPAAAPRGGQDADKATSFDAGALVSRKKDFVPAITTVINAGWICPPEDDLAEHHDTELFVTDVAGTRTVQRREARQLARRAGATGGGESDPRAHPRVGSGEEEGRGAGGRFGGGGGGWGFSTRLGGGG